MKLKWTELLDAYVNEATWSPNLTEKQRAAVGMLARLRSPYCWMNHIDTSKVPKDHLLTINYKTDEEIKDLQQLLLEVFGAYHLLDGTPLLFTWKNVEYVIGELADRNLETPIMGDSFYFRKVGRISAYRADQIDFDA